MNGVQIRIRGKVQGVGFRPFVWQLAQESARCGDVCNDGDGVLVRLLGDEAAFLAALTISLAYAAAGFRHSRKRRRKYAYPDCARCGHLPGVPGGDEQSAGSPLSLPVY